MSILDAGDAKQVQGAVKAQKTKEQIAKDGLLTAMSSVPGRAWLYALLMKCHPFQSPFNPDPSVMSFSAGEANIGLQLIAEMDEVSPELYLQMMKENK